MQKSPIEMDLTDRKIDLTFRLYVCPADEDYISSRICYNNGLFHVFYWCAAQACEKYMKAALLLQGRSVCDYGHDLVTLFDDICKSDAEKIVPERLDLPRTTAMGLEAWQGKPTSLYMDYLSRYGSPDNRYAFFGTFVNGPVLHALDCVCCALRRLMNVRNITGEELFSHQSTGLSVDDRIEHKEEWMIDPTLLLERLFVGRYQVGQSDSLRKAFTNLNFSFFRDRSEKERSFGGQHFHGSPLYNHLVRLAKIDPSDRNRALVEQMREWASNNIYMTNSVRSELSLPRQPRRST